MKKFKHLIVLSTFLSMLLTSSLPTYAMSNSSNWSFNFNRLKLDGKSNNKFHYLDSGVAIISGTWTVTDSVNSSNYREADIDVTLKRKTLLVDVSYGKYRAGSTSSLSTGPLYAKFNVDKDSDDYYLIWTSACDYADKVGNGRIYNQ